MRRGCCPPFVMAISTYFRSRQKSRMSFRAPTRSRTPSTTWLVTNDAFGATVAGCHGSAGSRIRLACARVCVTHLKGHATRGD